MVESARAKGVSRIRAQISRGAVMSFGSLFVSSTERSFTLYGVETWLVQV